MEFRNQRVELFTKGSGKTIKEKVMEYKNILIMELFIRANGEITTCMVKGRLNTFLEIFMMDNGQMAIKMALEFLSKHRETFTKANLNVEKGRALGFTSVQMEELIKGNMTGNLS